MVALPGLALWPIVTFCSLAHALTLDLYNVTSPGSISQDKQQRGDTHCTKDPAWLLTPFHSIGSYDFMCQAALTKAIRDLTLFGMDIDYELLSRNAIAQTTKPKMRLPRRYVAASRPGETERPSCTVAIAMINSLESGDPLPGQPPGPFGTSDITTMRELLYSPGDLGKPLLQCLRGSPHHPSDASFGWNQAGE